jgi:hypothetical protein
MVRVHYDIINEKPLLAFLGGLDFIVMQNNFFGAIFLPKSIYKLHAIKKLNFCIIKSTMIMIMGYIGHNKSQHH